MTSTTIQARLDEICSDQGIPIGHGKMRGLGRVLGISGSRVSQIYGGAPTTRLGEESLTKLVSLGSGTGTQRGYRAAPFIFMWPAGFMQARFKAEVACSEVSLDGESPPVFAMFFVSPKEKRGILVVDTPASAAACAPKGDKRRTGAGLKEFRDLMEAHDAYSKNLFRRMFGK